MKTYHTHHLASFIITMCKNSKGQSANLDRLKQSIGVTIAEDPENGDVITVRNAIITRDRGQIISFRTAGGVQHGATFSFVEGSQYVKSLVLTK
jgi:hypothetical protein